MKSSDIIVNVTQHFVLSIFLNSIQASRGNTTLHSIWKRTHNLCE